MEFNNALYQDIARLESYDLTLEVCIFIDLISICGYGIPREREKAPQIDMI